MEDQETETVKIILNSGYVGADTEYDTGMSLEEWKGLTIAQQQEVVNEAMNESIVITINYEGKVLVW